MNADCSAWTRLDDGPWRTTMPDPIRNFINSHAMRQHRGGHVLHPSSVNFNNPDNSEEKQRNVMFYVSQISLSVSVPQIAS